MTKLQTILAGVAVSALLAVPAMAQTAPDVQGAVAFVENAGTSIGSGAGESVTDVSEAYVGNPVLGSDGSVLGSVTSAATIEGGTRLLVTLDDALGTEVDGFTVELAAGQTSDGQVELGWTKEEVLAALQTQYESKTDSNG